MNYSAQAQPDLLRIADGLDRQNPHNLSARSVRNAITGLQRAVKFLLPEGGRYFETSELTDLMLEWIRLPYPVVALEANTSIFNDNPMITAGPLKEGRSTRRVALCWESDSGYHLEPRQELELVASHGPGLFVYPIFYADDANFWTLGSMGAFIPRQNKLSPIPIRHAIWHQKAEQLRGRTLELSAIPKGFGLYPFLVLPELNQQIEKAIGAEAAGIRQVMDYQDEFVMLMQFCIMLSCQNIVTRTHIQTTAVKNEKRLRGGKLPLYEYKILELKSGAAGTSSETGGVSREGPRCHLRRGHIRRLDAERRIWVRAAVVGNPHRGVIEKDYDARHLS